MNRHQFNHHKPVTILVADDDDDDRILARDALGECRLASEVRFVADGEQLLDYLHRRNRYAAPGVAPAPGLILLDLKMPCKDGREALREIKADARLRHIPIVVLTASQAEEDVLHTYDLGGNSFIAKPVTFAALVQIMQTITKYWLETVALPPTVGT